ncbi:FAD-dependent monooxygenase [Agromyces sp. H66]|uniref:FAD-dependent monooxygenase n=1 Tax=Agromyces sp. H66 TaxID=2529859 RepID=UPI0010AAC9DC|nr:FAD-dependent monooxygenase [Agromyces sp. H66]
MSDTMLDLRDVIVVGGGPVGLTAALWLADGGASVTVVESQTAPGDLPRAISIADETFRIMDRLGICDELKAETLLDTGSKYFGLNDRLLAASKPLPSRTGHPAKSQFDQPVLEGLLWDRAVTHPRIDFRAGMLAVAVSQGAERVVVEVRAPGDDDAPSERIQAKFLIGADGGKSFVRTAIGTRLVGSTQQERWIVVDLLNVATPRGPYAEFHGNGERPYVLVPGVKNRLRLEFMLFDGEDGDAMCAPDRIIGLCEPIQPGVRPEDIRRAVVYVAHQRVAEHYRRGRAFLIGDAAHLMPPFSGQGLNAGLRDASNIAWKLLDVLAGRGTDALLDSYESERRTHGAKMVTVSRRTGAVVMAIGATKTRLRDAAFRAVSVVPRINDYLRNMRFITPPHYADGVAAPASSPKMPLAGVIGRPLGQPTVTFADGTTGGLDRALGGDWALVQIGDGAGIDARGGYWSGLGARHVRVLPAGSGIPAPAEQDDVVTVVETADTVVSLCGEARAAGAGAVALLARPDKYVAAVISPGDEDRVIAALRAYEAPLLVTSKEEA